MKARYSSQALTHLVYVLLLHDLLQTIMLFLLMLVCDTSVYASLWI